MLCKRKFRELKTAVEEIEKALLEKSKINTIWHRGASSDDRFTFEIVHVLPF